MQYLILSNVLIQVYAALELIYAELSTHWPDAINLSIFLSKV